MRFGMASLLAIGVLGLGASGATGQPTDDRQAVSGQQQSGDPGSSRLQSPGNAATDMASPRHQRCVLTPAQRAAASNLAKELVSRIRLSLTAAEKRPRDERESFIEGAILRTIESSNDCPPVDLWAISLARETLGLGYPLNSAFDLAMAAVDLAEKRAACTCGLGPGGANFGGPPFSGSGGRGAGVTHPPVAGPQ
jgi:hypothetical protein